MKKITHILFILSLFVSFSCGYNSLTTKDANYTLPEQKNHPRLLYPKTAQINANTGKSKLLFQINKNGVVDKVSLLKSSGSDALDSAAFAYCQELEFIPAKVNGMPIVSRMTIEIQFVISNLDMLASYYVQHVNNLYRELSEVKTFKRIPVEREILYAHNDFVQNMKDALNFNSYVSEVISEKLLSEWKKDWDAWPLSFLLYHDFLQRFPDYDSLENVKQLLLKSLKYDIQYIQNTQTLDMKEKEQKEAIIVKIRNFMKRNYPNLKLENVDLENGSLQPVS